MCSVLGIFSPVKIGAFRAVIDKADKMGARSRACGDAAPAPPPAAPPPPPPREKASPSVACRAALGPFVLADAACTALRVKLGIPPNPEMRARQGSECETARCRKALPSMAYYGPASQLHWLSLTALQLELGTCQGCP